MVKVELFGLVYKELPLAMAGHRSTQTGERFAVTKRCDLGGVPRKKEEFVPIPGWASSTIETVFWEPDAEPFIRVYTSLDLEMLAELRAHGWAWQHGPFPVPASEY